MYFRGVNFFDNTMRQHKSGTGNTFALIYGRKLLDSLLNVLYGVFIVFSRLYYLEVVGEVYCLVGRPPVDKRTRAGFDLPPLLSSTLSISSFGPTSFISTCIRYNWL